MNLGDLKTLGQAIDAVVEALSPLDEATRATAIRAACEHLQVGQTPPTERTSPRLSDAGGVPFLGSTSPPSDSTRDIRWLTEQRRPKSMNEMACVVAYFLDVLAPAGDRKTEVTRSDMQEYFRKAGFRSASRPAQVLPNATARGFFESCSRGRYRLNSAGHAFVAHALFGWQRRGSQLAFAH